LNSYPLKAEAPHTNLAVSVEKATWEKLIDNLKKDGSLYTPRIIKAMQAVPRAKFLPKDTQTYATMDTPIQIGLGQSVSAPHVIAIMNEALQLEGGCKVLEVGAGSGWHAATIAEIVASADAPRSEWGHVYTMEVASVLADVARKNVMNAGYGDRVTIINGDGSKGYPQKAPYDRIVVTASAPKIPQALVDQLKSGGIMLIPIGSPFLFQNLTKLTKQPDGKITEENLGRVSFGTLTGEFGQKA
jgi:protein-L-isoaspartate(D-aspartate) O-methyltransferase